MVSGQKWPAFSGTTLGPARPWMAPTPVKSALFSGSVGSVVAPVRPATALETTEKDSTDTVSSECSANNQAGSECSAHALSAPRSAPSPLPLPRAAPTPPPVSRAAPTPLQWTELRTATTLVPWTALRTVLRITGSEDSASIPDSSQPCAYTGSERSTQTTSVDSADGSELSPEDHACSNHCRDFSHNSHDLCRASEAGATAIPKEAEGAYEARPAVVPVGVKAASKKAQYFPQAPMMT